MLFLILLLFYLVMCFSIFIFSILTLLVKIPSVLIFIGDDIHHDVKICVTFTQIDFKV